LFMITMPEETLVLSRFISKAGWVLGNGEGDAMPVTQADLDELWGRVGLSELRGALLRVQELSREFERALRALPPCDQCARARLLEQIRSAGGRLSSEAVNLSILAESVKTTVKAAEDAQCMLETNPPQPCHCPAGECRCHG